jgi:hypothetical protein
MSPNEVEIANLLALITLAQAAESTASYLYIDRITLTDYSIGGTGHFSKVLRQSDTEAMPGFVSRKLHTVVTYPDSTEGRACNKTSKNISLGVVVNALKTARELSNADYGTL